MSPFHDPLENEPEPDWEGDVKSMVEERRVRYIAVQPSVFISLFKSYKVNEPYELFSSLPDDARVLGWDEGLYRDLMIVLVWSASFTPVPENEKPPLIEIQVSRKALTNESVAA